MQQLIDFVRANPWIWAVLIAGMAVWIASIWVIVRSPKFRRKWLWALLSLASLSFCWIIGPGAMVSIGLPVGSLYVLWFWRFVPSPSAEALARDAERRQSRTQPLGSGLQVGQLRIAYLVAAVATAAVGWLAVSGGLSALMVRVIASQSDGDGPLFASMFDAMRYPQAALVILIAGLFVFLAFRPYWWARYSACGQG